MSFAERDTWQVTVGKAVWVTVTSRNGGMRRFQVAVVERARTGTALVFPEVTLLDGDVLEIEDWP